MIDLEKTIIGMILKDPSYFEEAKLLGLTDAMFSNDCARKIWLHIEAAKKITFDVDIQILGSRIPQGSEQNYFVDALIEAPTAQNFSWHCKEFINRQIVAKASLQLSALSRQMAAFDGSYDVELLRAEIWKVYEHLGLQKSLQKDVMPLKAAISSFSETFEKRISDYRSGGCRGFETGLRVLNEALGGWTPGRLYLLAARTSVGKTTMAVNFMNTLLSQGRHVLFCTNEMSDIEILEKTLSLRAKISGAKISKGSVNDLEIRSIAEILENLSEKKLIISLRSGRELSRFESLCRQLHRENKLQFVILDYVQQLHVESKNFQARHLEIAFISNRLKELARDLDIPILALAQVNRDVEKGGTSKMPNLSHLKDSGSLEQDADAVIIIHRETKDTITGDEEHTYLNIAKNRFGKTGTFEIKADLAINKFSDLVSPSPPGGRI